MGRHKAKAHDDLLEWQVCEDEATWEASQAQQRAGSQAATPIAAQKQPSNWRQWRQRWGLVLVAMTLLVFAVGMTWMQAQQGLATIESEVRSAVELDTVTYDPVAQQEFAPAGVQEAEILDLGNGWARVRVQVQEEDERIYRQTRVYQEQGADWVQVPPSGSQWGRPRQWESTYFHFRYYAQDEEAVKAAAPKLDALYPTFFAALVGGDLPSQKVVIEVDPAATIVPRNGALGNGATRIQDAPLTLPSPSATLAPLAVSEETLLVQGVALALFNRMAAQSDALYQLPKGRKLLRSGLRLWLLWDQELPLARWREPLVRWVFSADEGVRVPGKNVRVPAFARDYCAHHRLWLNSEIEIDAPVICLQHVKGGEPFEAVVTFRSSPPPVTLHYSIGREDFLESASAGVITDPTLPYASVVVFATLFEYISVSYGVGEDGAQTSGPEISGPERVAALVAAIPSHQSWETLIPAIFGVSRRDFEAGWNAFLAERYQIAP